MGTAATLGPPKNQPFSMYGFGQFPRDKPDTNGHNGAGDTGKKAPVRVFQHIDELLKAKPEVNIYAPIRRLLLDAESYAKQADTHIDFRRPDLALQDYVKASIIVVDIIPRHKEYPDLKADRGELHRLYAGLQKRISSQHGRFEEVKTAIKANNSESGVKPLSAQSAANGISSRERDSLQSSFVQSNGAENLHSASAAGNKAHIRTKPLIHPKPNALLGRAINNHKRSQSEQISKVSSRPSEDLESRFARLRMVERQKPEQRLQIYPKSPPLANSNQENFFAHPIPRSNKSPSGPREMPKASSGPSRPSKITLDVQIPDMPRPPDAIYSPDRASLDMRSIPPRSTPRASLSDAARRPAGAPPKIHPNHTTSKASTAMPSSKRDGNSAGANLDHNILNLTVINADDLLKLMKRYRILFIDIRSRAQFDSGHIMSQSILCVEPMVLSEDMSASQLEERLVVSPDTESKMFRKRREYDFVVYYDQSSRSNLYADPTSNVDEIPLRDFSKAISDYDYDKQLKCPPKLLLGGLDAWTQLMGQGALTTSNTLQTITPHFPHHTGTIRPRPTSSDQDKPYQSRPLTQDEESKWKRVLSEPIDDFIVRFPDIEAFEEFAHAPETEIRSGNSMTDASAIAAHDAELRSLEFREPARPALALSRTSYHGVSDNFTTNSTIQKSGWGMPEVDSISPLVSQHGRTGLQNFGNTCYMNAVLQAFSATPWFVNYLLDGSIDRAGAPPRKKGEMSDPPQLMIRNLSFLMRHLWSGQHEVVRPQTLRNYIFRIGNRGDPHHNNVFGGANQQDAQEFLTFMINIIEDETNTVRDKPASANLTKAQELQLKSEGQLASIKFHWQKYTSNHQSPITRKLVVSTMKIMTCEGCGWQTSNHSDNSAFLNVNLPRVQEWNLPQLLSQRFSKGGKILDTYEDVECEGCTAKSGRKTTKFVTEVITRLPDTLVIVLVRNTHDLQKNNSLVRFPLDDLNMDDYFYGFPSPVKEKSDERSITHYRCYAVIKHIGNSLSSGHYVTLARNLRRGPRETWSEYNDDKVTPINAKDTQTSGSYILFYQRVG